MGEPRDILIATCKAIEALPVAYERGLTYGSEIYIAPAVTWMGDGEQFEIQVVDGGDTTLDRDGSVRRANYSIVVALLLRRPRQNQGKDASILSADSDDLQTFTRAIRSGLDGNFLPYSDIAGTQPEDLLVRPLVYWSGSRVQTREDYPDLLVKELTFTAGINDELR